MIRYQCHSCGSKLNIKDELAGSAGKCPKCKTEFTVPPAESAAAEAPAAVDAPETQTAPSSPENPPTKRPPAKAKLASKANRATPPDEDDFDPVAFLMEDDAPRSGRSTGPPLSDDEIPADLELEIEEDEPPRRRSRQRRRVALDSDAEMEMGSASDSAGVMLSGASAGAARDLLTRTVEESRARASRIDQDEERETSPAREIAKELAIRGLPGIVAVLVVAFLIYRGVNAVLGSGLDLPDLGYVSGTVTLDGAPLAGAQITFLPVNKELELSNNRTIRVRPSKGKTDSDGYYELNYTQDIEGVAVGDHFVSISKRDGPRELAPSKYGPYSREKQTVAPGSQEVDFTLESDAKR